MALRKVIDGEPGEVEIIEDNLGRILLEKGEYVPANGPYPQLKHEYPEDLPHIDESLEVHGLTDLDPDFFAKQEKREEEKKRRVSMKDRMFRGGRRKE